MFTFSFKNVRLDAQYNMARYFPKQKTPKILPSHNIIAKNNQRILILLGFRIFSKKTQPLIQNKIEKLTRQLNKPIIIFQELLLYLEQSKIVFPQYTTLQDILGKAIVAEEERLCALVLEGITPKIANLLENLFTLKDDKNTYDLTALKRYPKNFSFKNIQAELEKHKKYYPIYQYAKKFLPTLGISRQNIIYYSSLVEHYQVQSLNRFLPGKRRLYLMCYAYHRFQVMNDQLIQTLIHYVNTYKEDAKTYATLQSNERGKNIRETHGEQTKKLLYFYRDKKLGSLVFREVQEKAIRILPDDKIVIVGEYMVGSKVDFKQYEWEFHGNNFQAMIKNLRPLIKVITFQASARHKSVLEGVKFIQSVFRQGKSLSDVKTEDFPIHTIPINLKKYLLRSKEKSERKIKRKNPVYPYRYEFYICEQLKKLIESNTVYSNDTTQYKSFSSDLGIKGWTKNKKAILAECELPRLNRPMEEILKELKEELEFLIISVNERISNGENKAVKIKGKAKDRTWTLPYEKKNKEYNNPFYDKLPPISLSNLLDFVEEKCGFMEAFTNKIPHYAKSQSDLKGIKACIIANATSLGIFKMGGSSDLSYNFLSNIEHNHIRLETLREANDIINRKTAELPIFKRYNLIENILHGSADGQKIKTRRQTFNARHSSKYYGLEKGMAPYSLILNHMAANALSKGPHEHEGHYLWDLYFNNTSNIDPDRISTDTEGSNLVNFVPFYFKGVDYAPCYRTLSQKTKKLYGFKPLNAYDQNYLIRPSHKANEKNILEEESHIQAIMISLVNKENALSVIIKKLCAHQRKSKTKEALWDLNNILQSIYLLKYIDDPQLRQTVRAALNRGEAYHALRRKIGETNGLGFRGASDLEVAIWNECARLVCNAIIFYNASLLSSLMEMKELEGDLEAVAFICGLSPAACQHLILTGRYEFNKDGSPIDMATMLELMKKILKKHVKMGQF